MWRKKAGELTRETKKEKKCSETEKRERNSGIRIIGGEIRKKGGGQISVRVYMHLDVCLCSHASKRDGKRERNRERETTNSTLITFTLEPRSALRAWTIREQAGKRANERAGPVRTTADYIDFDFRRRAHLVLSGSAHSCRSRLPNCRGHWSCPRAETES